MVLRRVYNSLFAVLFWAASPWLLIRLRRRGSWREGLGQRFGRYRPGFFPNKLPGHWRLWLHAVSVGEVNTCLQFVRGLQERMPRAQLVVSTTTNTGRAELMKKLPPAVTPIYFPVDLRASVRRALDAVQPDAVILVERELWPNFLWELQQRAIPLFLINARISDRSHRAYRRWNWFFRSLYARFDRVAAQTELDAGRLRDLGCRREALEVTGSLKFDAVQTTGQATDAEVPRLLARAGKPTGALVLVAGSTHEGEEALLARVVRRLRNEGPDLFLVLVPRHFERASAVMSQLQAIGIRPVRRSDLHRDGHHSSGTDPCLLVDSTGELMAFYAQADIVFVGKSLCARGGQNPIEPAALGKPMVFGRHMQNFPGVTRQLLEARAAIQVENEQELTEALTRLVRSPRERAEMGRNAQAVVRHNAGATRRTVELIAEDLARRLEDGRLDGKG